MKPKRCALPPIDIARPVKSELFRQAATEGLTLTSWVRHLVVTHPDYVTRRVSKALRKVSGLRRRS